MNLTSLVVSNQIISIQLLREQPFDFYGPGWGDVLKKIVRARLCKKTRTDHKKKKKGRTRPAEEEKERKVERLKEYWSSVRYL